MEGLAQEEGDRNQILWRGGEFQGDFVPGRGAQGEIDVGGKAAGGDGLTPDFGLV